MDAALALRIAWEYRCAVLSSGMTALLLAPGTGVRRPIPGKGRLYN